MNNKFFPSNFLFMMIMFLGTILSLSSSHWLTMWLGLEFNLMGFLPLMNIKGKMLESEASMKYFIIQTMSSSTLIMSTIMMYYLNLSWYSMLNSSWISIPILLSLIMKLGGAPLHFWMPSIAKQMSWNILFLMLTWQKLAPLLMLGLMNGNLFAMMLLAISSTIMGSIMALNQTNIQMIMTFSSISHLGWMLSTVSFNTSLTMVYLLTYIFISMPLMFILAKSLGNHIFMLSHGNQMNNLVTVSLILSLAGLPPLLGFMSKLMMVISLIKMNMIVLTILLFLGTLISLYFYMNMSLMLMIKSYKMLPPKSTSKEFTTIVSLNLLGNLILYPLIYILIMYAMTIFYKP